jgi:hypothetical protein
VKKPSSLLTVLILMVAVFLWASPTHAQRGGGGRSGGHSIGHSGPVSVRGYVRRDGTFVPPHFRSSPDGIFSNNWSSRGNVNPFTGKSGTRLMPLADQGLPTSFVSRDGRVRIRSLDSNLGAEIPSIASPLPQVRTSIPGNRLNERALPPIRTIIDLPPNGSAKQVRLDQVRPSSDAIVFLPPNVFGTGGTFTTRSHPFTIGARDERGRIRRSASAKAAFVRMHPCPSTGKTSGGCPGYVVDHIGPLATGGADDPSNMQWQTAEAAKAKDKIERRH